jgi:hypothetical protein
VFAQRITKETGTSGSAGVLAMPERLIPFRDFGRTASRRHPCLRRAVTSSKFELLRAGYKRWDCRPVRPCLPRLWRAVTQSILSSFRSAEVISGGAMGLLGSAASMASIAL